MTHQVVGGCIICSPPGYKGAMSLGKGVVNGTLTCQKLNTKSSTEAELAGVNDVMPKILWTRYFWKRKVMMPQIQ
jgi:hypothetical protein